MEINIFFKHGIKRTQNETPFHNTPNMESSTKQHTPPSPPTPEPMSPLGPSNYTSLPPPIETKRNTRRPEADPLPPTLCPSLLSLGSSLSRSTIFPEVWIKPFSSRSCFSFWWSSLSSVLLGSCLLTSKQRAKKIEGFHIVSNFSKK